MNQRSRLIARIVAAATLCVAGCQAPLPHHPFADAAASLSLLADRQEQVRTVQATALVTLTAADGEGVSLDAALAARLPDHLRLRAWKMNRAVFDLTVRGPEAWLMESEPSDGRPQFQAAQPAPLAIRRSLQLLNGSLFRAAEADHLRTTRQQLVAILDLEGTPLRCFIDRGTLTPRRFEGIGSDASRSFTVTMDDYAPVDSIAWPGRLRIQGPEGRIEIVFRDIQLNDELSPTAFDPPARAVKQP